MTKNMLCIVTLLTLVSGCGLFPEYHTYWLPINARMVSEKGDVSPDVALSICKPQARAAEVEFNVEATSWESYVSPRDNGLLVQQSGPGLGPHWVHGAQDVGKGVIAACMAEYGYYPVERCVNNC